MMRVLMITSEWPSEEYPFTGPFIVEQVKYLKKAGVQVDVFSFRGKKNLFNYLRAYFKVRHNYPIKEYAFVHAQFGQSGAIAALLGRPFVVTFHGGDLDGFVGKRETYAWEGRLLRFLSKQVARKANKVILVSEHLAKWLPRGLSYTVIPCGVDRKIFCPKPKEKARKILGLNFNESLVLFGGNPKDPIKRFHLAEKVIQLINLKMPAKLITIEKLPHHHVATYMNACDALLLTSKHEGSPCMVKEALNCNLPVVSVDAGDVAEQVSGISGCYICPSAQASELAEALEKVLINKNKPIEAFSVLGHLDQEQITQRLIELYQQIIPSENSCAKKT